MTEDQWRVVWGLYQNAQNIPEEQREAFVKSASVDPVVFDRVLALLSGPDSASSRPPADPSRDSTPLLEQGRRIGRYTITGVLGRGGMADAFSAYDAELDRLVALKVLRPAASGDAASADRSIRKAKYSSSEVR